MKTVMENIFLKIFIILKNYITFIMSFQFYVKKMEIVKV